MLGGVGDAEEGELGEDLGALASVDAAGAFFGWCLVVAAGWLVLPQVVGWWDGSAFGLAVTLFTIDSPISGTSFTPERASE